MHKKTIRFSAFQFFVILFLFTFFSCSKNQQQTVTIVGDIPNLPDGVLYLWKETMLDKIDSVKTSKGHFEINYKINEKSPIYIGIFHEDKNKVKRIFGFLTNVPKWGSSTFMSDPLITIKGNMEEYTPVNIKLPTDVILVNSPKIQAGKQTEALFNTSETIFTNNNLYNITTIKEKLKKYPFSYHILYKISENKNSFSPKQVDEFLKSFKGEITQSETYKKLSAYNEKRFNEKSISLPILEDKNGVKKEILDKKYNKHLVVFWASWCGPCRQEIPLLKRMYKKYGSEIEFISISTDEDKNAWKKAMNEEKMEWKQLLAGNSLSEKEALQIHFKLNSAIPYTVVVDNNLKILSSSTGLSNEKELEKLIKK